MSQEHEPLYKGSDFFDAYRPKPEADPRFAFLSEPKHVIKSAAIVSADQAPENPATVDQTQTPEPQAPQSTKLTQLT